MLKKLFFLALLFLALFQLQAKKEALKPATSSFITIGKYLFFLQTVASATDQHGLYSPDIENQIICHDDGKHFDYALADKTSNNDPLIGLSEINAMRYCNWIEHECPSESKGLESTENGVFFLFDNSVLFDHSNTSHHHLIEQNTEQGSVFMIVTVPEIATVPE